MGAAAVTPASTTDATGASVVLFADLAGFTTVAERLTSAGHGGTEELHALLNEYFGLLIASITAAGGEVTTFAGDALAAVFPIRGPLGSSAEVSGRAYRSARRIQEDLRRTGASNVRIGLALGEVTRVFVGDPQRRTWHVLAGPGLTHAVDAQGSVGPGEVGVHPSLPNGDRAGERSGDRARPPQPEAAEHPTPSPGVSPTTVGSLLDEHRIVTTAFVGLPEMGVAADGGGRLQAYLDLALPIIESYDADLRQIDAGDKGYQLVLGFGAPRAAADDAERAVACCQELLRSTGVVSRAGVATGPAFCAVLGTSQRSEYVVIGDSVNIAARLAQAAGDGEVWLDAPTARRCSATDLRPLGRRDLKGRRTAVEVFAARGRTEEGAHPLRSPGTSPPPAQEHDVSFVGRAEQMALVRRSRRRAHAGRGEVVLVLGEPGVGKSRFAVEAVSSRIQGYQETGADPPASGDRVVLGGGRGPGDRRPYIAWRPIARELFAEPGQAVTPRLDLVGGDDRAPLLGPLLGVDLPETSLTCGLDAQGRADATRALLLDSLRRVTETEPLTLVLDDGHWLDELSLDAAIHVATQLEDLPVLLVVATRDEPRAAPLVDRLSALPHCTVLRLDALGAEESAELVSGRAARLGVDIPPGVAAAIAQRGAGNPLFLAELVAWAAGRRQDSPGADDLDLPPDVERLVLARVDRLTPDGRTALKAASVVEDGFTSAAIDACLGSALGVPRVDRCLAEMVAADLVTPRQWGIDAGEPGYGFRHALVHEVVYGSLSSAVRADLHEHVGDYLERRDPDERERYLDLLAHHYGRSRATGKQRIWFRAAGDASARAYANDAALQYYARLAELLPEADAAEVLLRRGAVLQLTGRWTDAEADLARAEDLAGRSGRALVRAEAGRELGLVLLATRRYDEAVARLSHAAADLAGLGDTAGEAAALDRLAFALLEHGEYDKARQVALRQLSLVGGRDASAMGDLGDISSVSSANAASGVSTVTSVSAVSAALGNMALVEWGCGDYAAALPTLRRAYALARRSGDRRQIVHVANDLAGLYAERGDHRRAALYLGVAVRTARHMGYRQATAFLTGNAGELYREHGDYAEAASHFATGLRAALDLGDWITTARCVVGLAITAADQGAPDRHELLRRASVVAGDLHESYVLAGVLLRRARAAYDDGDVDSAWELSREAEVAAQRLSEHGLALPPRLLRLRAGVRCGRVDVGDAVRQVRGMLPEWTEAPERAALLGTLAALDPADAASRAQAAALYRDLFRTAPSREYAGAYAELTGGLDGLPEPVVLPRVTAPIESDHAAVVDIGALIARVERLAASAGPGTAPA